MDPDGRSSSLADLVSSLVPSMARRQTAGFNVFDVMHHGTHEKQLSNVFAWLLDADGTHGVGHAFQSIFIDEVNHRLEAPLEVVLDGTSRLAVRQEVEHQSPWRRNGHRRSGPGER